MIRFRVFAGVSSDAQLQEKDSIPHQIKTCRNVIQQFEGLETGDPFIVDGYSRTGYDSLDKALADIPPLRDAIDAAEKNLYDVLIMDNWERLGDLGQLVLIRFRKYKKQLYSARQSGRLQPPESYDPDLDESAIIDMHIEGIIQSYRINKIRRGRAVGMPKRTQDGLPPAEAPYGYRLTGKKSPPEQIPEKIAKLLQAREMLLSGKSYKKIAKLLGVAQVNVPEVLGSPWYAGIVTFGKTKTEFQGEKKVRVKVPRSKWVTGQGQHKPLWSQQEHEDILSEISRRAEVHQRHEPKFVFYGMLRCGVCNEAARLHWYGWATRERRRVVACRVHFSRHVYLDFDVFMDKAVKVIQEAIRRSKSGEVAETEDNRVEMYTVAMGEKRKRRANVQDMAETGAYTASEASKRVRELDSEIDQLQRDIERIQREKQSSRDAANAIITMAEYADDFKGWIVSQKIPQETKNAALRAWIRHIVLEGDGTVTLVFR